MSNYQVLFNGEVASDSNQEVVRENLARELVCSPKKPKIFKPIRIVDEIVHNLHTIIGSQNPPVAA